MLKMFIVGIVGILVFIVPSLFSMAWTKGSLLIRTLLSLLACMGFYHLTPNYSPDPTIKLSLTSSNPIIDFRTSRAPLLNVKDASLLDLKTSTQIRNNSRSVIILSLQYVSTVEGTRKALVQNEELSILFKDEALKYYGSYIVNVTDNSKWLESKENLVAREIGSSVLESEILFYPVDKKTTWGELKARLDLYKEKTLTIKVQSDINGRKEFFFCDIDMDDYKLRSYKDTIRPYPSQTIQPACI